MPGLRTALARLAWGTGEDERGFSRRLFCTTAVVYALFFNPYLQSSMTWNFLDLAASLVETGRPYLLHTIQYRAADTAATPWGTASGEPLGPSLPLIPLYAILRMILGSGPVSLPAFNGAAIFLVAVPAGATLAVLIYLQARRYGNNEQWCRTLAWLGAFGTQLFPLSTMYTKEILGTLAAAGAFYVASGVSRSTRGLPTRRLALTGFLASLAGLMIYPLWMLLPALAWYLHRQAGRRGLLWLLLAATPSALLLVAYNHATFGSPLLVGYLTLSDPRGSRVAWPGLGILWDLTLGTAGGLFFYHPILLLAPAAFWFGRDSACLRRDLVLAGGLLAALLLIYGAWLQPHADTNAFIASLGLRMLLPAVPPLVAALAVLPERWQRPGICLGGLSVLSGMGFAAAGLIPGKVLPLAYIAKVSTTTLASGLLFADALPRLLGVETVQTEMVSHRIAPALLWHHPRFLALVAWQLSFRLLSLLLALGAACVLSRLRFSGAPVPKGGGGQP